MSSSPTKNNALDSPLRRALEQPPLKRFRMASKTAEVGTVTEPESLGACEPGTSINLDGIVWNETKGGMLSLNITWRGKSYMGTLIDCSVTDHGSEWAAPWSADTEAPDQRTRYLRKKKNKKKKKKKKPGTTDTSAVNISNDSIEEEKTEIKEDPDKPLALISCSKDGCEKKFTSESALKYHVTFAHERIKTVSSKVRSSDEHVSNGEVITDHKSQNDLPARHQSADKNSSDSSQHCAAEKQSLDHAGAGRTEKTKSKTFPSTQHIRPILPAQGPQLPGSLKPIQPKPAILPPPTKNLNLDTLKKPLLNKSPTSNSSIVSVKSEQSSDREEATAIDLSSSTPAQPGAVSVNGSVDKKPSLADLNHKLHTSSSSSPTIVSSAGSPPKSRTPIISVKSEFNTGNKQSLSDSFDADELEVLKHISKPSSGLGPVPSISSYSPFPAPPGHPPPHPPPHPAPAAGDPYLPGAFLAPALGLPPSFMLPPPSSTAPHLLPGLMGLNGLPPPPPTSLAALSPFGASLESLARAAEERSRSFGGAGSFSPAHSPMSAAAPGAGSSPAGARPGAGGGTPQPPGDKPGDPPLLRHEHMHTHLHYITSPTHGTS